MKFHLLFLIVVFALQASAQRSFKEMADEMAGTESRVITWENLPATCLLLDARAREEFATSHISGAAWVGYDDFDLLRVAAVPKNQPIVVYCSVGYRSGKIAEKLTKAGYTEVYNLWGGIFHWYNSGKEVVDKNGPTSHVHPYNEKWSKWLDSKQP